MIVIFIIFLITNGINGENGAESAHFAQQSPVFPKNTEARRSQWLAGFARGGRAQRLRTPFEKRNFEKFDETAGGQFPAANPPRVFSGFFCPNPSFFRKNKEFFLISPLYPL